MNAPDWATLVRTRLMYGRDRARTIGELQEQLGTSRRIVERAIEQSRLEGFPVISDGDGVYLAQTAEEVRACADRLNRRLVTQYKTVRAMRRTAQRMRAAAYVQTSLFG
jgi:hypothetical protein